MINHIKLLKHNLAQPFDRRLHGPDIEEATVIRSMAANAQCLLLDIHKAIAPKLRAMRDADAIIDRIGSVSAAMPSCSIDRHGRGARSQGEYITPYSFHPGNGVESNLARENDAFYSVRQQASNRAFEHTQTTAGGQHAND